MGSYVGFRASPPRGLVGIPARSGSRTPCPHISLSHAATGSGPRKGTSPGLPADGGAWCLTTWWPWHPGGGWCSELGSTGPGSGGGEGPHKDPAHCSFQRSQGTLGTLPKTCSLSASPVTLQEFQGSASLWPVLTASPAGKGTHRVLPSLANIAKLSREGGGGQQRTVRLVISLPSPQEPQGPPSAASDPQPTCPFGSIPGGARGPAWLGTPGDKEVPHLEGSLHCGQPRG